jgi:tetratricopeptide (TPR) repeat protein
LDFNSQKWRPVYLDEVSIVLVRRSPETEDLIKRFEVGCEIAPIPREQLPLTPANFNQWVNAARVLSALGRNSEALAAADKAMAIFPNNAHARWYRGQILYAEGRHVEAEDEWKRALALSPREITPWASLPEFQAAVWSSLADLYHRDERIAEAVNALQRVTELSSDPATKFQALANLGALEEQMGQPAAAEKHWLAALSLSPNDPVIWTSLGDLYNSQKRLPEAIDAMQKAVKNSSDPAAKTNELIKIARLSLMNRQPKLALQALDEAEKTAPADVLSVTTGRSFNFNVAQGRSVSWMVLGNLPQATSFAEQAVQLDPDAPDAWNHLAKLYERQGRTADRDRAEEHGRTLATNNH